MRHCLAASRCSHCIAITRALPCEKSKEANLQHGKDLSGCGAHRGQALRWRSEACHPGSWSGGGQDPINPGNIGLWKGSGPWPMPACNFLIPLGVTVAPGSGSFCKIRRPTHGPLGGRTPGHVRLLMICNFDDIRISAQAPMSRVKHGRCSLK